MPNTLAPDYDIDVVKITLKKKSAPGTTVTYYLGLDYWAADAIYSGSPVVYPVLATAPRVVRRLNTWVASRQDTEIQIYGKAHLDKFGRGLLDLRDEYELHGAAVEIYYYSKPSGGTTTNGTVNKRQVLEVINISHDDSTGLLRLTARDTWFKDKNINRNVDGGIFPSMKADPRGDVGFLVFGEASTVANGIVTPAPIISSVNTVSENSLTLFTGWVGNNSQGGLKKLYARNPFPEISESSYIEVNLKTDCTTAESGDATITGPSYPTAWQRDTQLYQWGRLYAPATPDLLTCIGMRLDYSLARCADIQTNAWLKSSSTSFSKDDPDFSFSFLVKFDAVSPATSTYICSLGRVGANVDWAVWLTTGNNIAFGISTNGTTIATTHTNSVSISAGTWYHVAGVHDKTANTIRLWVNNTAAAATSTGANVITKRGGAFCIALNGVGGSGWMDGKIQSVALFDAAISTTIISDIYNSGAFNDWWLTNTTDNADLDFYYPLSEPYGQRKATVGSDVLTERGGSTSFAAGGLTQSLQTENFTIGIYDTGLDASANPSTVIPGKLLTRAMCHDNVGGELLFGLETPIPRTSTRKLLYVLEGFPVYRTINYLVSYKTTVGTHSYARAIIDGKEDFAQQTDTELSMAFYVLGSATYTAANTSSVGKYSTLKVNGKVNTILTGNLPLQNVEFKISQSGVLDDGSGTITGSASSVLKYPADIAEFILRDTYIGAGLSSGLIDTSSFTTCAAAQAAAGLSMSIAIREPMDISTFIQELCRQGRMQFYKTREGKLAVRYCSYTATRDVRFNEAMLGGDLLVLSVTDGDYSEVVNEVSQGYAPDELNVPKDAALIRRASTDKFTGLAYIDPTSSDDTDTGRQSLASTSQSLYGKRLHDAPLDFFDTQTKAKIPQRYIFDRFSVLPRRVVVRVPRARYYSTVDLFSQPIVEAVALEAIGGTAEVGRAANDGNAVTIYDEGLRSIVWSGGSFSGEVVGVVEEGPFMMVEIESVNPF